MIAIKAFLKKIFGIKDKIVVPEDSNRIHIKDVKSGENIKIEWHRIKGKIGWVKCINNDPKTKKILLEVHWNNHKEIGSPKREQVIFGYDAIELCNFHLLNQIQNDTKDDEGDEESYDISDLQKKMNEALEKEEYEIASKLQKQIDKLTSKN